MPATVWHNLISDDGRSTVRDIGKRFNMHERRPGYFRFVGFGDASSSDDIRAPQRPNLCGDGRLRL